MSAPVSEGGIVLGFLLVGLAGFAGDAVPATWRILMLVGGVASLGGVIGLRRTRDPGAAYPYPAPENPLNGRRR
jgi:Zn-dependent protease